MTPPVISSDDGRRQLRNGDVFVFDRVTVNQGDAYDNVTGKFVAPSDGAYHFTALVSTWDPQGSAPGGGGGGEGGLCLHVDGQGVSGQYGCVQQHRGGVSLLTAQVLMTGGTRVWLEAHSPDDSWAHYDANLAHFGGLLLTATAP